MKTKIELKDDIGYASREEIRKLQDRLLAEQDVILEANRSDVEAAGDRYGDVMIDRLTLTP